jgi:hypothetical protein
VQLYFCSPIRIHDVPKENLFHLLLIIFFFFFAPLCSITLSLLQLEMRTRDRRAKHVTYFYLDGNCSLIFNVSSPVVRHAVEQLVKNTALRAGRSRVRFSMVSLEFFIHIILPTALCSWGRLSL